MRKDLGAPATGGADPELVRFDRKAATFLGVLLVLFAVATAVKVHGSSISIWNDQYPDRAPRAGLLVGSPRAMRSDEWGLTTPAIVSQAASQPPFGIVNDRWGPGAVPLVMNLPVKHWSLPVRPQFWGFFFLDLERAFAFYWNMKALLLAGGVFLLLLLLTGNDFGISLLGTAWVFFSGFVQWWYSSPTMMPETIGCVALVLVAAHYVALAPGRWAIGAWSVALAAGMADAALSLYPPFQVPLAYLALFVLLGSLGPRLVQGAWRKRLAFRVVCTAAAIGSVASLLAFYYRDIRSTIEVLRATVYPGARISTGGDLGWAQVFGGFYGFFMSERSSPQVWGNVCEASNFVLLFPVPIAALVIRAWRRKGFDLLEGSLAAYLGVVLVWSIVGWPRALAAVSGFSLTHGTRPLLGLGLASIFLCCVFIARGTNEAEGRILSLGLAASWTAALVAIGVRFDQVTGGFATLPRVLLVAAVAGAAGYFLLARKTAAFAACVLVPNILAFGLVNPVAVGLGPILDTSLYRGVSELVEKDPHARWTVYGGHVVADLFKAAGADVFNGMKFVPPLDDLRVLDPAGSSASVYNRSAHIALAPAKGSEVVFKLLQVDEYRIEIDPRNELWRRLGIRYVALPAAVTDGAFLAITELVLPLPDVRIWIYRYRQPA